MTLEELYALMETREIPGSRQELDILCIRIGELRRMNGERWVIENRDRLLKEWNHTICYLQSAPR